jgi:uncharacterized protein
MNELINSIIYEPWPWWVGGPLIGVFVIVLLLLERKQLGISSSYDYICGKMAPINLSYFKDSNKSKWQFFFVIGLMAGGTILFYLNPAYEIAVSEESLATLSSLGIEQQTGFVPKELYNFSTSSTVFLLLGGFSLGFGARYANGCTAGHAIMGVAQFAPSSIIATTCFFIGGLFATHLIIPLVI